MKLSKENTPREDNEKLKKKKKKKVFSKCSAYHLAPKSQLLLQETHDVIYICTMIGKKLNLVWCMIAF